MVVLTSLPVFFAIFAMVLHIGNVKLQGVSWNCRNSDFSGGGRQKEISEILELRAP